MPPTQPAQNRTLAAVAVLRDVGAGTERTLAYLGGLTQLIGRSLASLLFSPLKRKRSFDRATHQALVVGVKAIPIITRSRS